MTQEEIDVNTAKRFVSNDDWKWAKAKLEEMMDIYKFTVDYKMSDTSLGKELKRRKDVIALLNSWIEYIEGTAQVPDNTEDPNNLIQRF